MQPIIDYGSVVWNQRRLKANNQITLIIKRITRLALGISQFTPSARYICFEKRCELMNIDLPDVRLKTQAAIYGAKLIKNETLSKLTDKITPYLGNVRSLRRTTLFRPFNNVPNKSPAYMVMDSMRYYQDHLKLELTIFTNKSNLKKFNSEERTRRADLMQARSRGLSISSQRAVRY